MKHVERFVEIEIEGGKLENILYSPLLSWKGVMLCHGKVSCYVMGR